MSINDSIQQKITNSTRLSREDAHELFLYGDLLELGLAANEVCQRMHPEPFRTYVVDRNINYTNICISRCKFCAFYRNPGAEDGYLLSDDVIYAKIAEAFALGATQILMQGGLHPDLKIEYYEHLMRGISDRFGVDIHSFSPPEIVHIAKVSGLSIEATIERLRNSGLSSIPGGGAEVLSDSSRARVSPGKCSASQWLDVMETAHKLGMRTTATMMFGHGESISERLDHLTSLRDLQDRTGGFTAFIPWTFQPTNTELGGQALGGYEYLRMLAISRLFLDNFANIQASWVTQGAKIGQIALHFGGNDLGSTMIEENVVAAAGVSFRMSEEEMRQAISVAGFLPRRRDTYYKILE